MVKQKGALLCRRFWKLGALSVRMASINVRKASSASGPAYSDVHKILKVSVASVSPPSLVNAALSFDRETLILRAGDSATYSINKNVRVVAFGKAVLGMVAAVESILQDHLVEGVASIPVGAMETARKHYPHHVPSSDSPVKIYEGAAGNSPDEGAAVAAKEILALAHRCGPEDVLLALVSGGGSALLPLPVPGVSLEEKREVVKALARGGASIHELNTVRKALSQVKGGRLALAAHPARLLGLILSDVVGNDMSTVASGPTVPQRQELSAAREIVEKYSTRENCLIPLSVTSYLTSRNRAGKPTGDNSHVGAVVDACNLLVGCNKTCVAAAKQEAMGLGYASCSWSLQIQGEARKLGRLYALVSFYLNYKRALPEATLKLLSDELQSALEGLVEGHSEMRNDAVNLLRTLELTDVTHGGSFCLLGAGEPTVTVKGTGKGGRNQELVLAYSIELKKLMTIYHTSDETGVNTLTPCRSVVFASLGTDGQDGDCDAAGAMVDDFSLEGAQTQSLDPDSYLTNNDSYTFFSRLNSGQHLIATGLTGTNVMDLHLLLFY